METNFGRSTPYSVGVEEEFQILDRLSCALTPRAGVILESFTGEHIGQRIKPEVLDSMLEVSTKICASVPAAVEDLADLRERVCAAAANEDLLIASAGTHPFSPSEDQHVTESPRYLRLARRLRPVVIQQAVFGLHVHVGVNSPEKATACADGVRAFLPELLAISANSPFWQGRASGFASTRAWIFESFPRSGIPPVLGSMDEFEALVDRGLRTGSFPDSTYLWWDVRPHPKLGTVEIRVCDVQTRTESTAAIVALCQALVATLGSAFECGEFFAEPDALLLAENKSRAARDGLEARLIDLETEVDRPAADAIRSLVEWCEPAAEALGCAEELELVESILTGGNGADDQLRVYRETESLRDVAEHVARETAPRQALVA